MAAAMSQHATQASRVEEDRDRLVEHVSSTGARPDELELRTRVGRHDSVYQANVSTIRAGIEQTVNTSTQHGRLFLDGDQLAALQDSHGQLSSVIPAEALMALIRPQSKGDFLDLYHGPPLADLCTNDLPRDPCLELLKTEASGTTDDPEPGGSAPPPDSDDGARAPAAPLTEARVAELLSALLAGAEAKLPVLDSGASTDTISEGIRDFVLHSGPAVRSASRPRRDSDEDPEKRSAARDAPCVRWGPEATYCAPSIRNCSQGPIWSRLAFSSPLDSATRYFPCALRNDTVPSPCDTICHFSHGPTPSRFAFARPSPSATRYLPWWLWKVTVPSGFCVRIHFSHGPTALRSARARPSAR